MLQTATGRLERSQICCCRMCRDGDVTWGRCGDVGEPPLSGGGRALPVGSILLEENPISWICNATAPNAEKLTKRPAQNVPRVPLRWAVAAWSPNLRITGVPRVDSVMLVEIGERKHAVEQRARTGDRQRRLNSTRTSCWGVVVVWERRWWAAGCGGAHHNTQITQRLGPKSDYSRCTQQRRRDKRESSGGTPEHQP